jgi:hypothetical protein
MGQIGDLFQITQVFSQRESCLALDIDAFTLCRQTFEKTLRYVGGSQRQPPPRT